MANIFVYNVSSALRFFYFYLMCGYNILQLKIRLYQSSGTSVIMWLYVGGIQDTLTLLPTIVTPFSSKGPFRWTLTCKPCKDLHVRYSWWCQKTHQQYQNKTKRKSLFFSVSLWKFVFRRNEPSFQSDGISDPLERDQVIFLFCWCISQFPSIQGHLPDVDHVFPDTEFTHILRWTKVRPFSSMSFPANETSKKCSLVGGRRGSGGRGGLSKL